MTDENGKYNYAKAVHSYPPFFDISCSAKNYKIASALTVLQVVYIAVTQKGHALWSDALAVLPLVLLIVATITLAGSRIVGIAAIMTFENNAQNMADLTSAIVGIAACLVAAIVGIAASFFDTVKE